MKSVLLFTCAALCAACATPEKIPAAEAFYVVRPAPLDPAQAQTMLGSPKIWARQYLRDIDCERAARDLDAEYDHETAWKYLKGCLALGNFTQLKALCDHWAEDLKTRPEAGPILAEGVAARGGHLKSDLELIQRRRIPLFELDSALKQSSAFKGRYLLLVAKISEAKQAEGKTELMLIEQAITSEVSTVLADPRSGITSTSTSSRESIGQRLERGRVETRVTDCFEETGQEVIAKLARPDPFLPADKNLVFLVRFDGTAIADTESADDDDQPHSTALVTLISYHGI